MRHVDFNPELHPRDKEGQFARGGGDLKSHLEAKVADNDRKRATGRNTVAGILVGGKVIDSSELPRHEPSAAQQASLAEARKYVNMDLKWPTRQDLPRMMDRDAKQAFITAQFHGILGRKGLDTDKLHTATLDDIMAHTGLPEERRGEVKDVLTELEARGVVFAKGGHLEDERGYWINKAVGSGRSGGGRGRPGRRS